MPEENLVNSDFQPSRMPTSSVVQEIESPGIVRGSGELEDLKEFSFFNSLSRVILPLEGTVRSKTE